MDTLKINLPLISCFGTSFGGPGHEDAFYSLLEQEYTFLVGLLDIHSVMRGITDL